MSEKSHASNQSHAHSESYLSLGPVIPESSLQDKLLIALAFAVLAGLIWLGVGWSAMKVCGMESGVLLPAMKS